MTIECVARAFRDAPSSLSLRQHLVPQGQNNIYQEGREAQASADGVQRAPAEQELLGEFGIFVQGGIEEALVGGQDYDEREGY